MKTVVIFLLCASVTLRALAAPAEDPHVQHEEVKEEPKPQEAEEEHSPMVPEVHSQLCLPGWEYFKGSCFYLNNNYNTWRDAASFCANFEATLASVQGFQENNHLQHMAGSAGHTSLWTGGYFFESQWRWQDGSGFTFNKLENIGSTTNCQCVRMNTQANRGWYNDNCGTTAPSICQIKVNC